MIDHLKALQTLTNPLRDTYLFEAPGDDTTPVQYLIWQAPGWGAPDDLPLSGDSTTLDTDIRLLARSLTGEAVGRILQQAHDLISPGLLPALFTVAGRRATIRWVRSEFIAVDQDVTIGAGTHPAYGIDTYHIHSQRS